MTKFQERLKVRSGAPSAGVVSHRELQAMSAHELNNALSVVRQEITTLLSRKRSRGTLSLHNSAQFRRRLAQLAMNKRLLEEELEGRPALAG